MLGSRRSQPERLNVCIGRGFLANPDLVERLRIGAEVNEPDAETFYGGGAKGYTDHPVLSASRPAIHPLRKKLDDQAGLEGFELLKPTDERNTWLVITRWADDKSFQAWVSSPASGYGYASEPERADQPVAPHVGMSSELWSYEVAGGSSR